MNTENLRLSGTSIAPGLAMGSAFVYRDLLEEDLYASDVRLDSVEDECRRVQHASEKVIDELEESATRIRQQVGPYQAEIFVAHQMMLRELIQSREIREQMETAHINAEAAVHRVFQRWAQKMYANESTRFIERGDDVADLGRRLLRTLMGVRVHPLEHIPDNSVLVARNLLPSDAVFLAQQGTLAIITEFGSAGSHCALMIRQMGIPGLCNVTKATEKISIGDTVFVDGFREAAMVRPNENMRARFNAEIDTYRDRAKEAKKLSHETALTAGGIEVPVYANVAKRADVQVAADNGADGIGLYRLETLFMLRKTLPTEEELVAEISDTLAPLKGKPAMVRLLDVGSDKDVPYLEFDDEPAPCLGMRGVRVLLAHPQLLQVQIRALLRVSQTHNIQIMVPMVTIPEDMQAIRHPDVWQTKI